MALVWIAVALLFAVAEVATVSLFAAFLSAGAVGAVVVAFLGFDPLVQALAFGVVSLLGILLVRPWLMRRMTHRRTAETVSGAASMIGETAVVVRALGPAQRGHVTIWGENWPALTHAGVELDQGRTVRIIDIEGATLVVEAVVQDTPAETGRQAPSGA